MNDNENNEARGSDAIEPVNFGDSMRRSSGDEAPQTGSATRAIVIGTSIALFFIVLAVLFVLPRYVQSPPTTTDTSAAAGSTETDNETTSIIKPEVSDPDEARKIRLANQEQLERALEKVATLEQKSVDHWAPDEFASATADIKQGEKDYREQRYLSAQSAYASAIETLDALIARTGDVVIEAVDAGYLHIAAGESDAAVKAFEAALQVEPDHELAQKGLARAKTLDQVLALVNEAAGFEELGETSKALARYREALALDAHAPGAASAIANIQRDQLDSEFRRAMSNGFSAFDRKDYTAAKSAFEQAQKLKPNATETKEALNQVNNQILSDKITAHLNAAVKAERAEAWSEAAKRFRAAHKLDNDLRGAENSAKLAASRAKLDAQLQAMISRPDRLGSDAVHREAKAVLARARAVNKPGKRLTQQITTLSSAIEVARTPIPITLVSDNATAVTLYKVGPLGQFTERAVSVIPGEYVVVGRRDGFRDARVEFKVSPERSGATITIRCDEKLAFGG